jgi:hypothetical protein
MSIPRPNDLEVTEINSDKQFFDACIKKGREWIRWFDRFIEVFEYPLEWFKTHNVDGAYEMFNDLISMKDNKTITLIKMKTIADKILKLLRSLNSLLRLCHILNCLIPFRITEHATTNGSFHSKKFISDLKRSQQYNKFFIDTGGTGGKSIPISSRQNVHWFIASEKSACNVKIEYLTNSVNNNCQVLFMKENVPIESMVLDGEFETQQPGLLIISIENESGRQPRTIWFRIKSTNLSRCHLFHGIFNIFYEEYFEESARIIKEAHLNQLLDRSFTFIDKLLIGTISLREMVQLKTVFCDKNIIVQDEVRRLFTSRTNNELLNGQDHKRSTIVIVSPTDAEIKQMCEWLQIYQYYSHINHIIGCIEKFDILSRNSDHELVVKLKLLRDNENCTLREVSQIYDILQKPLKHLSSSHLQLIKTMVECSAVVQMLKSSDLYSTSGRQRFQELRDNLTTQFQLQERNNMILDSLLITYILCEPFVVKAESFEEFANRVAGLSNVDDNSFRHIKGKV